MPNIPTLLQTNIAMEHPPILMVFSMKDEDLPWPCQLTGGVIFDSNLCCGSEVWSPVPRAKIGENMKPTGSAGSMNIYCNSSILIEYY